jgi:diguanylate cyclase (GGDEF)-like protein/PAS domain S-box-containing protein
MSAAPFRPDDAAPGVVGTGASGFPRTTDAVEWVRSDLGVPLTLARWAIRVAQPWEVHWSDGMYDQYGLPRGGPPPTNESFFALLHPDDANLAARLWHRAFKVPGEHCWRLRLLRSDGAVRHIVTRMTSLPPNGAGERWYVGLDQDVTDLVHDRHDLDRERAFRFVADNLKDVVFRISRDGVIEYASRSARHLLGREPETLIGVACRSVIHPDDVERVAASLRLQIESRRIVPEVSIEYRVLHADGSSVWIESAPRLVFDANGNLLAIVDAVRDITQRRQAAERIEYMATHDALTDLPNRRAFHERLGIELAAAGPASPLALAYLDLDGFKPINDRLGHAAGDEVLRQVARRLRQALPAGGHAGRLGGDEFAVVLPATSRADAACWARRIVEVVRRPIAIDGDRCATIGVSVGLAEAPTHARDVDGLLRRADEALYRSKARARNAGVAAPSAAAVAP